MRYAGAPPVEFSNLLGGPLGQPWPPLRYKHEFFARYLPRGPSLQYLEVDPGPMYAISAGGASGEASAPAQSLLAVTRAFSGMADFTSGGNNNADDAAAAAAADEGLGASLRHMHERRLGAAAPLVPAGTFQRGSLETSHSSAMQQLQGRADQVYDMSASVGQQFAGAPGAPGAIAITSIGPAHAVVTALGGGPRAAALNGALLGRTRPGEGPTLADESLSGGAVFAEGASGLAGGRLAVIQTAVHPLDAFPATKRFVADEKAAQIDAERLRRRVVAEAVRRDALLARAHPHGALQVDHLDNADSAVYGEVAARRRAERDRFFADAALRESRILAHQSSIARRGYDVIGGGAGSGGSTIGAPRLATLRVDPATVVPADARAARDDGVQFLQNLVRAPDNLPPGQATSRVMTGQRDSGFVEKVERTANISRQEHRAAFNVVTGAALNPIIAASRAPFHDRFFSEVMRKQV
jgi:hypothetical protein